MIKKKKSVPGVVPDWSDFLWDQRCLRLQYLGGIDRKKTSLDLERSELDLGW